MKARYTHGAQIDWPLLMEREGQTFFYHADALGSVAALTDSSGNVVRSYMYHSWGRPQGTEATGPDNPFQFAGREYDLETGLYYVRARYYDPAVGRFISADPLDLPGLVVTTQSPGHEEALLPQAAAWVLRGRSLGLVRGFRSAAERAPQKLNAYAYALNNPLAVADPSGLRPAGVCEGAVVGAAPPSHDWRIEEQLEALEAEWESAPWWQKLWDWLKPRHPGWVAPEGMQGIKGETGSEA